MAITVTTLTTITTVTAMGLALAIGAASLAMLILFLTTKELASTRGSGVSLRIVRFLSIAIVPLVVAFVVIAVMKIIEILA